MGNVWVVAEQWRGQLSETTFELVALGREIATGLGVSLEVVLLGQDARELGQQLGAADAVLCGDEPGADPLTPESLAHALAQLIDARRPHCLLIPVTNVSWDVLGLLAARLDAPLVNFCQDVRVVDGQMQAKSLLYGGKMEVTVVSGVGPTMLGIFPGRRPAAEGKATSTSSIEEVAVAVPETLRVKFTRLVEPEAGDVDLAQQEVLVAVGRGIQTQENVSLAEELASALGGAVCGSRPVIDQGWLSLSRQVGRSGAIVKPKLYLAAGVSGAPEHVEGMKDSDLIIAINTDPEAPIFNVAHYGIVADVIDALPALVDAVGAAKG